MRKELCFDVSRYSQDVSRAEEIVQWVWYLPCICLTQVQSPASHVILQALPGVSLEYFPAGTTHLLCKEGGLYISDQDPGISMLERQIWGSQGQEQVADRLNLRGRIWA